MNPMNKQSLKERLAHYKNSPVSLILLILVLICAALTVITLIFIVIYILIRGIPHLSLSLFSPTYNSDNVSMLPAIINTFIMTLISLIIAVPLGIFSAIYLVEYAKRGNKLVGIIRMTTETLSGIPSIVYGLFGFLFFLTTLKLGYSILSGALTLAIMILPLIMRTTEERLNLFRILTEKAASDLGLESSAQCSESYFLLPSPEYFQVLYWQPVEFAEKLRL